MPIFGGYKPTTEGLTVVKELGQDRIDIENAQTLTFTFEVKVGMLPAVLS